MRDLSNVAKPCETTPDCPSGQVCVSQQCRPGTLEAGVDGSLEGPLDGPALDGPPVDRSGPDSARPDLPLPDSSPGDLPQLDTSSPDVATSDMPLPDAVPLDSAAPDLPLPDSSPPDAAVLCGNGKLDPSEQCDDKLLGKASCTQKGYTGGQIGCTKKCTLDPSGCYTLPDPGGIKIASTPYLESYPAVAYASPSYLVVWHMNKSNVSWHILGGRVSSSGKLITSSPIQISNKTAFSSVPYITSDNTFHMVAWLQKPTYSSKVSNILGTKVSALGAVSTVGGNTIHSSGVDKQQMTVATGHKGYFAVWSDQMKIATSDPPNIRGTPLSIAGAPTASAGKDLHLSTKKQTNPDVAWDGSNYLLVWQDDKAGNGDVYGRLLKPDGTPHPGPAIPICATKDIQTEPRVVYNGASFLVVWQDDRNTYNDIYGARVSGKGVVQDAGGFPVGKAPGVQQNPGIAVGAGKTLVVWLDYRNTHGGIYGAVVGKDGTVHHTQGIPISPGVKSVPAGEPEAASDGKDFIVVWHAKKYDPTKLYNWDVIGARVSLQPKTTAP